MNCICKMLPQLTPTNSEHSLQNQTSYLNTFELNHPHQPSITYETWTQSTSQFTENSTTFNANIASLCDVQMSSSTSSQLQTQHQHHQQQQNQLSYQFSPISDDLFQPEEIFQLDQPLKSQNTTQFPSPPTTSSTTTLLDLGSGVIQHKQSNKTIACSIDGLYDETISRSPIFNQAINFDPSYCESGIKYFNDNKISQQHPQILSKDMDCFSGSYYGTKESYVSSSMNSVNTTNNVNYLNNNNNNNNNTSSNYYGTHINNQQNENSFHQTHHQHQQNHNPNINYSQYSSYSSSNEFNSSYHHHNNNHYQQYLAGGNMSAGDGIYSISNHN